MMKIPLKPYWDLLSTYLKIQKGRVILLILLLLSSIGLQLANPQVVRYFIDAAESKTNLDKLFGAAALFMTIALVRQVVSLAAAYVGEVVAWTATNQLRVDLALHCLNLDLSFHKAHKPGELIERVDGDVNELANFFSQLVIRLSSNLLLLTGILGLLWLADWRVGFSITVVVLLGGWGLGWLRKHTIPRWEAVRQAESDLFGYLEEWLNGTEEIRSSGAVAYIIRRSYQLLRARWLKARDVMRIHVFVVTLPIGIFGLAYAAAHILGTSLFQNGAMTIGGIYLIFYYIELTKGPLWEIRSQIADLQKAAASINRIAGLRRVQPTILDGPGLPLPNGPLAVEFDHVSFYYEDDVETNILTNVNFSLAPGTVLGLLGRTGSGKSTLTKLLFRFYDPTIGAIRLGRDKTGNKTGPLHSRNGDGAGLDRAGMVDLRDTHQAELRHCIGLVTQEVQLFQASVRDNLTLFDDRISNERILQVLDDLGLRPWLASLSDGLETPLESGGSSLSAGEAQLLAFARVFLADPGLVILDEASSRLDPATEQLIERAIDKLLANRTAIIIAHRLATVQRADEIMILAGGRIAEYGLRAGLAGDPQSRFYHLLQTGLEEAFA